MTSCDLTLTFRGHETSGDLHWPVATSSWPGRDQRSPQWHTLVSTDLFTRRYSDLQILVRLVVTSSWPLETLSELWSSLTSIDLLWSGDDFNWPTGDLLWPTDHLVWLLVTSWDFGDLVWPLETCSDLWSPPLTCGDLLLTFRDNVWVRSSWPLETMWPSQVTSTDL